MNRDTVKNFRLGILVVTGTALLLAAVYLIGLNQHLFGTTIRVSAYFYNVNGLQPGDNVRFAGTDAGTVESVEVVSDTSVRVVLVLKEKYAPFIKNNAVASIATDGLMGSKLVNIMNDGSGKEPSITDGCTIPTLRPVETDEMLRTLNQTNDYVSAIALNLKKITDELGNSRGLVWKLLTDTVLADRVHPIFINLQEASARVNTITADFSHAVKKLNSGDNLLGALITDTLMAAKLHNTVSSLNAAGEQSALIMNNLSNIVSSIEKGEGALGLLTRDSTSYNDLKLIISNMKQSSENLNKSLEALKKSPLLRKYIEEEEKKRDPKK